ncbi:uncharacterized protein LOC144742653 [Ciona intestinalis]
MSNGTKQTEGSAIGEQHRLRYKFWLADTVIISCLTAASMYVILALVYYEVKRRRSRNDRRTSTHKKEEKYAAATRLLCIAVALFSVVYNLLKLAALDVEKKSHYRNETTSSDQSVCNVLPRIKDSLLILATGMAFLFLWTRQRVFYISPSLRLLNNTTVKVLSFFLLILWFLFSLPAAAVLATLVRYKHHTPGGCKVDRASALVYKTLIITWVCACAVMQIGLLGLFLRPILKRTSIKGYTTFKKNPLSSSSKAYLRVFRRVKRAVFLTTLCLLSDAMAAVLVIVLYRQTGSSFGSLYSISLTVNLISTVGCYDNWKHMIWPWFDSSTVTVETHGLSVHASQDHTKDSN